MRGGSWRLLLWGLCLHRPPAVTEGPPQPGKASRRLRCHHPTAPRRWRRALRRRAAARGPSRRRGRRSTRRWLPLTAWPCWALLTHAKRVSAGSAHGCHESSCKDNKSHIEICARGVDRRGGCADAEPRSTAHARRRAQSSPRRPLFLLIARGTPIASCLRAARPRLARLVPRRCRRQQRFAPGGVAAAPPKRRRLSCALGTSSRL